MLIDTHIWVWWVAGDPRLTDKHLAAIAREQSSGIYVSVISVWEVAKLVEHDRLMLSVPVADWLKAAETYPGVSLLPLTTEILIDSTQLPGEFHKDPADQMIVATARVHGMNLMTLTCHRHDAKSQQKCSVPASRSSISMPRWSPDASS